MYNYQVNYQIIALGGFRRNFVCTIRSEKELTRADIYYKASAIGRRNIMMPGDKFHLVTYRLIPNKR